MPGYLQPLLMIVAFIAMMYFLMVRPQQKRLQEHEATIKALEPGSRVLLTSGVFATIRHLGEQQAVVELSPGVSVTIKKSNIARPVGADEEEFDYVDDVDEEFDGDETTVAEAEATLADADVQEADDVTGSNPTPKN